MASEFWDYFAADHDDDDLDEAIDDAPKAFDCPSREELVEALGNANASAKRLADTIYYAREHGFINDLLYKLEEQRGR